jgi:hypothetical protein
VHAHCTCVLCVREFFVALGVFVPCVCNAKLVARALSVLHCKNTENEKEPLHKITRAFGLTSLMRRACSSKLHSAAAFVHADRGVEGMAVRQILISHPNEMRPYRESIANRSALANPL